MARQERRGRAWQEARQERPGMAEKGEARPGAARQDRNRTGEGTDAQPARLTGPPPVGARG
jgi:hypothetical protein